MMKYAMVLSLAMTLMLVFAVGGSAVAYQRNPMPTNPSPTYSPSDNNSTFSRTSPGDTQSAYLLLEEKRGKALNTERQRMMIKEAGQLVQAAADLQASVNKGIEGAGREEQAKRAEAIEKLARDVKERMKGSR